MAITGNTKLVLGGVVFRDFEIPSEISFPQAQAHHIHKLVGGGRVIDCIGQDPEPITWKGRFRDADASSRSRRLERMAASGAQVYVSWGSFFYRVVVTKYEPKYENSREIPYDITLTRVPGGGGGLLSTVTSLVGADVGALSLMGGAL